MADVSKAIDYVLRWEDSTLSGKITATKDGKRTRFGIDEHYHPELTACLFYGGMGRDAALMIARGVYAKEYAEPLHIADIQNQDVANRLLALGVNVGLEPAAKMLQEAVYVAGDGHIGPLTLHALDLADPDKVIADLREQAEAHYEAVLEAHPEDEIYRVGWLRRASA